MENLNSYLCYPVFPKLENVILSYPHCGHGISHAQIGVLLPWAIGRIFQLESQMADELNSKSQEKVVLFLQLLYPQLKKIS